MVAVGIISLAILLFVIFKSLRPKEGNCARSFKKSFFKDQSRKAPLSLQEKALLLSKCGLSYYNKGQFQKAIRCFYCSLKLHSDLYTLWQIAYCHFLLEEWENCKKAALKGLNLAKYQQNGNYMIRFSEMIESLELLKNQTHA